jgi:L-ascorbate metabolism protein UlaG (beta-lactamase superfamily)
LCRTAHERQSARAWGGEGSEVNDNQVVIQEDTDNRDSVFLRPEAKMEPLFCRWYVWTHMVPPAQRAMNIAFRLVPLLKSFTQNPAVHFAASQDKKLFGGPFVHLGSGDIEAAKLLLGQMQLECGPLLKLASEIKEFDTSLQRAANGFSLSEFYLNLPDSLRGLVELSYDLNNHPKIRLHEELVYDEFFKQGRFELLLTLRPEADRRFFMSTPRLTERESMSFSVDLDDARIDRLARMRTSSDSFQDVAKSLAVREEDLAALRQFFTSVAPRRVAAEYLGQGVRVRYFGHACVLIQSASVSILLDPMFASESAAADGRLTLADLPEKIDYLVISHGHQDHCAPEMLIQIRHRVGCAIVPSNNGGSLCDPSLSLLLQRLGLKDVRTMDPFSKVGFVGGSITALPFPGEHVDLDIHSKQGIQIEIEGRLLVFLVDSDCWDPILFRRIARRIGRQPDALFLGMECHGAPLSWLYGPLLTKAISRRDDESRRLSGLDSQQASKVIAELSPKQVYVYAMGQEPWLRYIMGLEYTKDSVQLKEVNSLLAICKSLNIPAKNLYLHFESEF